MTFFRCLTRNPKHELNIIITFLSSHVLMLQVGIIPVGGSNHVLMDCAIFTQHALNGRYRALCSFNVCPLGINPGCAFSDV